MSTANTSTVDQSGSASAATVTMAAEPGGSDIELAKRYHVERTWRQIRNGLSAESATASPDDGQLSVALSLERGNLIEPRGDLVQDEKGNRGRNADVANEPTERVE